MFKRGDRFKNTKNGTYAEIKEIKNDVATMICEERILGFFKTTSELVDDVATRTIHLKILKKVLELNLIERIEE